MKVGRGPLPSVQVPEGGVRSGVRMSAEEVVQVAVMHRASLEALGQSGDKYKDDFYCHALAQSRRAKQAAAAAAAAAAAPESNNSAAAEASTAPTQPLLSPAAAVLGRLVPHVAMPGPALSPMPLLLPRFPAGPPPPSRAATINTLQDNRTREWEHTNHILGHSSRSSLSRPREVLQISRPVSVAGEPEPSTESLRSPEELLLWSCRRAVEAVHEAAIACADAQRSAAGQGRVWNPVTQAAAYAHLQRCQHQLCVSVGVDPRLAFVPPSACPVESDHEPLALLLSVPKGKRCLVTSVPLMHPHALAAAVVKAIRRLPHIVASVAVDEESAAADRALAAAVGEWVNTCCDTTNADPRFPHATPCLRVGLLCHFLSTLLSAHPGAVLRALLYHEGGAVVMGSLLVRGEAEAAVVFMDEQGTAAVRNWHELTERLGRAIAAT